MLRLKHNSFVFGTLYKSWRFYNFMIKQNAKSDTNSVQSLFKELGDAVVWVI